MSKQKDMGGSAFPVNTANICNPGACFSDEGMTLWDWYAGHALAGLVTRGNSHSFHTAAENAKGYADAMLEQRRKRMEVDDGK